MVFLLAVMAIGCAVTRKHGNRRGTAVFVFAFSFLYLASIAPPSDGLLYLLERNSYAGATDDRGPLDVVVVLAGGVTGNRFLGADTLNRQSAIRVVRAVEVFHSTSAEYLVCSGTTESFNEAEIMAATARQLGVPAARIKIDMKSRNTREHAVELSRMFSDRRTRLGLVTSAYHMPRSTHEFRKYFQNVVSYPTDYLSSYRRFTIATLIPSAARLDKLSTALSELVGIAWYRLRETLISEESSDAGTRRATA